MSRGQRGRGVRHHGAMSGTLEVRVLTAADAVAAEAGGADRLEVVGTSADGGRSPEPRLVSEISRRTNLPLRPLVRLRKGFGTDGGEAVRLAGLVSAYIDAGADGVTCGFLNGLGEIDTEVLGAILEETPCPWTFHRAVDSCLNADRAWNVLLRLPRLDAVRTAGSARDLEHGLDELVRRAERDADVACLVMADGEVRPEHVPWLARAGVNQIHIEQQARPQGSKKATVDEKLVRSWATLLSAEIRRRGRAPRG